MPFVVIISFTTVWLYIARLLNVWHFGGDVMQFMPDILPATSETVWSKRIVATSLKIGFLGLGTMGSAIVSNLLKSGHDVTIWNRTVSKVMISTRFQLWTTLHAILRSTTYSANDAYKDIFSLEKYC